MTIEHFGKLLTQGLKSIAALEKLDLTALQNDLGHEIGVSVWTIYKWRDGTSVPNDDMTIALLSRACVLRGHMDRQWLLNFLSYTIYSNKQNLISELCPGDVAAVVVSHNLPRCQQRKTVEAKTRPNSSLARYTPSIAESNPAQLLKIEVTVCVSRNKSGQIEHSSP